MYFALCLGDTWVMHCIIDKRFEQMQTSLTLLVSAQHRLQIINNNLAFVETQYACLDLYHVCMTYLIKIESIFVNFFRR